MNDNLLKIIEEHAPVNEKTLKSIVDMDERDLHGELLELKKQGYVYVTRSGKYSSTSGEGFCTGILEIKRKSFGFVRRTDGDVFVSSKDMGGALNGERVTVKLYDSSKGNRPEGKVVHFAPSEYCVVGEVVRDRQGALMLLPEDNHLPRLGIQKKGRNGAVQGQKVVGVLTRRPTEHQIGLVQVREILGDSTQKGVDILAIARTFGLVEEFGEEVIAHAESFVLPTESDYQGRKVLFDDLIITIDGADAKDLDDAVSLTKNENGNYTLGVHIADVSHYVTEGSFLDVEAQKRGTSVYLLDRVIPMLPRHLSNGICSLLPHQPRLTLSCFMECTPDGRVLSHTLEKTVINTRHRMTYSDVNAILAGDPELVEKYADILLMLQEMQKLSFGIRERRHAAGSIDFELDEAKILLDDMGWPVEINLRERGVGEKLIEDFMIAANETVAADFFYSGYPFVYRVHEPPEAEKLRELSAFLKTFGIKLHGAHSKRLQNVIEKCKHRPEHAIINRVVLRSLQKAKYHTQNLGHYGLGSSAYCHFTSPIRRYPDLLVHRLISARIAGELTEEAITHYNEILSGLAAQSGERERNAIDAERHVEDLKKVEFMQDRLGQTYKGIVSGISNGALFVELPNTVEGVIPLRNLTDDYYVVQRELYCVVGERSRRRISLGDELKVRVDRVDMSVPEVVFALNNSRKKIVYRPRAKKRR